MRELSGGEDEPDYASGSSEKLVSQFGDRIDGDVVGLIFTLDRASEAITVYCAINLLKNGTAHLDDEWIGDAGSFEFKGARNQIF